MLSTACSTHSRESRSPDGTIADAEVVLDPPRYPSVVRQHELRGFRQAQVQGLAKKGRDRAAKGGRRQIAADGGCSGFGSSGSQLTCCPEGQRVAPSRDAGNGRVCGVH